MPRPEPIIDEEFTVHYTYFIRLYSKSVKNIKEDSFRFQA